MKYGEIHRDNDLPVIIHSNSSKSWYHEEKCHRRNGNPAVIYSDGPMMWYYHGQYRKAANFS
jgi:hypothetical protein